MARVVRRGVLALALSVPCASARAQVATPDRASPEAARISVSWDAVPIRDVLLAFSTYSGKSIVSGAGVSGTVTATILDKPWDVALRAILSTRGLLAFEDEYGIIRVEAIGDLSDREAIEPIETRAYRLSFVKAEEIRAAIEPLLSPRGSISVSPGTNTIIVSDIARVHAAIGGVIRGG